MLSTLRFLNVGRTFVRSYDVKIVTAPKDILFCTKRVNIRDFSSNGLRQVRNREIPGTGSRFSCLKKPFLFTVLVAGASYPIAAIWQYESLKRLMTHNKHGFKYSPNEGFSKLKEWLGISGPLANVVTSIIIANVTVFVLWRVPGMERIMTTYFASCPTTGSPSLSLLLSAFSHLSFFHLLANMYVFKSFTPLLSQMFGPEQFLATYVTAAVVSGFGSYVVKVIRRVNRPSIGASGAIIAFIGMACQQFGDARLSIAFVDSIFPHSFSGENAMKGLIILDTLGLLLGWKLFDHAAHLSGMIFGIWYINYGQRMIWSNRDVIVKKWHSLRNKSSKN